MNSAEFCKSFTFVEFQFHHYHHTDNSHGINCHYFGYLKKGECLLVHGKTKISIKAGEFFYLPKGLHYHSYWKSDDMIVFDSFAFDYLPCKERYCMQKITLDHDAKTILTALSQDKTVHPSSVGLLYLLFGKVSDQMQLDTEQVMDKTVQDALHIMKQNSDMSMADIARTLSICESKLYYAFKHSLGKTPNTVRQEICCEKAIALLSSTDLSIEEISAKAGFSSSSYFRKIFFQVTGKTPRQVRNEKNMI